MIRLFFQCNAYLFALFELIVHYLIDFSNVNAYFSMTGRCEGLDLANLNNIKWVKKKIGARYMTSFYRWFQVGFKRLI